MRTMVGNTLTFLLFKSVVGLQIQLIVQRLQIQKYYNMHISKVVSNYNLHLPLTIPIDTRKETNYAFKTFELFLI